MRARLANSFTLQFQSQRGYCFYMTMAKIMMVMMMMMIIIIIIIICFVVLCQNND